MMKIGLQAKLALLIGALLTVIFGVITYGVIKTNTTTLRNNLHRESYAFAELASTPIGNAYVLYKDSGRIKILQEIERFADLDPNVTNVRIINTAGEVLFSQHESQSNVMMPEGTTVFKTTVIDQKPNGSHRTISPYIERFGLRRYAIVYDVSGAAISKDIARVTTLILALGLIGLIFTTTLLYVLVSKFFIKPIKQVSAAAAAVKEGNLEYDVQIERADEIGELANSVRNMADRLKEGITQLRQLDELKSEFMMITSHNLRTPISIMRGYLEMLNEKSLSDEARQIVDKIVISTNRLKGFAEDIMTISTIESGEQIVVREKGDLRELVNDVVEEYRGLIEEKKIDIRVSLPSGPLPVTFSKAHLSSAIWNILDNAYKFTGLSGHISISAVANGNFAEIEITDDGIGIPEQEKPRIFAKFHRGTSTTKYEYEGVGLGLYITKIIIEEHGGTIDLTSQDGHGTTVKIKLPLADGQPAKTLPAANKPR